MGEKNFVGSTSLKIGLGGKGYYRGYGTASTRLYTKMVLTCPSIIMLCTALPRHEVVSSTVETAS